MSNIYKEAFKAFRLLEQNETFDISEKKGIKKLEDFLDNKHDEKVEVIVDIEAEDPENIKDSYVGDIVLECPICKTKIYKNPSEIIYNEDEEPGEGLVNEGEECPHCQVDNGFKVVGKIAPLEDEEKEEEPGVEEKSVEEKSEEELIAVENDDDFIIEESLKQKTLLREQNKTDSAEDNYYTIYKQDYTREYEPIIEDTLYASTDLEALLEALDCDEEDFLDIYGEEPTIESVSKALEDSNSPGENCVFRIVKNSDEILFDSGLEWEDEWNEQQEYEDEDDEDLEEKLLEEKMNEQDKAQLKAYKLLAKSGRFAVIYGYSQGNGKVYLNPPLLKDSQKEVNDFVNSFKRGKEGTKITADVFYQSRIKTVKDALEQRGLLKGKKEESLKRKTLEESWDDFSTPESDALESKYLPDEGEGENLAQQAVTATSKLIYKWFNDGDVFDNNYNLSGWWNDLSSFANWLFNNISETKPILNRIKQITEESEYEALLKDLMKVIFDKARLEELSEKPLTDSVYTSSGPFSFTEEQEEDDWDDDEEELEESLEEKEVEAISTEAELLAAVEEVGISRELIELLDNKTPGLIIGSGSKEITTASGTDLYDYYILNLTEESGEEKSGILLFSGEGEEAKSALILREVEEELLTEDRDLSKVKGTISSYLNKHSSEIWAHQYNAAEMGRTVIRLLEKAVKEKLLPDSEIKVALRHIEYIKNHLAANRLNSISGLVGSLLIGEKVKPGGNRMQEELNENESAALEQRHLNRPEKNSKSVKTFEEESEKLSEAATRRLDQRPKAKKSVSTLEQLEEKDFDLLANGINTSVKLPPIDDVIAWISEHDYMYELFQSDFDYDYDEDSGEEKNPLDEDNLEEVIDWINDYKDTALEDFNYFFELEDDIESIKAFIYKTDSEWAEAKDIDDINNIVTLIDNLKEVKEKKIAKA